MQIQFVKSFLTLYETQNMTRASERLFITQQCLSRQLGSLEKELDSKLFIRRKSGMQPTELCVRVYPEFKKIADSYDSLVKLCRPQSAEADKRLSVVVADGMSSYLDMGGLMALIRNYGYSTLVLDECPAAECSRRLQNGNADMAFILEPFDDTLLEHELIIQEYGVVAMLKTNPLARESGPIPFRQLDGLKTVTGSKTNCAAEHLERYCEQTGVRPDYVGYVSNLTGYINTLREDDQVVTILKCTVPKITNPDIVVREIVEPRLVGRCHCCIKRGTEREERLKVLVGKIKEQFLTQA